MAERCSPEAVRAILMRHARLDRTGRRWLACQPSREELRARVDQVHLRDGRTASPGTDGKVIYDTREAAAEAAKELAALFGIAPHRPHRCSRARHGHFHLTPPPG